MMILIGILVTLLGFVISVLSLTLTSSVGGGWPGRVGSVVTRYSVWQ